jgi:hypothetical protein
MIPIPTEARGLLEFGARQGFRAARQRYRRRRVLACNGVVSMLRAKAMMATLSEEFRLRDKNTTSPTASSVSATYISIKTSCYRLHATA